MQNEVLNESPRIPVHTEESYRLAREVAMTLDRSASPSLSIQEGDEAALYHLADIIEAAGAQHEQADKIPRLAERLRVIANNILAYIEDTGEVSDLNSLELSLLKELLLFKGTQLPDISPARDASYDVDSFEQWIHFLYQHHQALFHENHIPDSTSDEKDNLQKENAARLWDKIIDICADAVIRTGGEYDGHDIYSRKGQRVIDVIVRFFEQCNAGHLINNLWAALIMRVSKRKATLATAETQELIGISQRAVFEQIEALQEEAAAAEERKDPFQAAADRANRYLKTEIKPRFNRYKSIALEAVEEIHATGTISPLMFKKLERSYMTIISQFHLATSEIGYLFTENFLAKVLVNFVLHRAQNLLTKAHGKIQAFKKRDNYTADNLQVDQYRNLSLGTVSIGSLRLDQRLMTDIANTAQLKVGMGFAPKLTIAEPDNPEDTRVACHEDLMDEAIAELYQNAAAAMEGQKNAAITVFINRHKDQVIISICDNGGGVAEEHREKIFEPGFTTKPGGSGQGLALIKTYIEDVLGGTFTIENIGEDKATGTAAVITLPLSPKQSPVHYSGVS